MSSSVGPIFRLLTVCWLAAFLRAGAAAPPVATEHAPRQVESVLEAQIALHRRGFSCGSIDGVLGAQTAGALRAYQRGAGIAETGQLDAATREILQLETPAFGEHTFTEAELAELSPLPATWLEKSQQPRLGHATALELAAERYRASPNLLKRLNPEVDWDAIVAGVTIKVPGVEQALVVRPAALLNIRLEARELDIYDEDGRVVGHFPVSIARRMEKRPVGELRVKIVIRDPNYTFDPELFAETSPEAREIGRKLIIPPGPNNPVGRAWIGLDRPGYGIHGTPDPEKVGRTESLGCFRLANWDALTLVDLVRVGTPVFVDP